MHDATGLCGPGISAPRKRPDLIVFGEDWGSHPSSTQHLVGRMAAGRRILWVNSIGLRRPRPSISDIGRAARKLRAAAGRAGRPSQCAASPAPFPAVQPLVLPMAESRAGKALNRALLTRSVGGAAARHGLSRPVVWVSLPSAVDALGRFGERAVVYYCGDDFGALSGVDHAAALRMEDRLVRRADLIFAASPALAARFPSGKTRLLPHGVDYELFASPAPRPPDLPSGRPVAGFYGSLAPWIDTVLIARAARLLPEWLFFLIGPVQTDISAFDGLTNVVTAGPRPHAELAAYARHWDAGIIPFLDTPQIRACNPLKLREYLAAGRPVVATPFPAMEPYACHISAAADADGFAACLRASLGEPAEAAAARRASVAGESWQSRAAEADRMISELAGDS